LLLVVCRFVVNGEGAGLVIYTCSHKVHVYLVKYLELSFHMFMLGT
jgi:hypothetical protein